MMDHPGQAPQPLYAISTAGDPRGRSGSYPNVIGAELWDGDDMTITAPPDQLLRERASRLVAARAVDASKTYGTGSTRVTALDHVSVEFGAGDFTAIMGPSGSGKSTLMHCLAGLDSLSSGQILIGDGPQAIDLASLTEKQLTVMRRDRIGFVFQAFNLVPTLTAAENIALPMRLAGHEVEPDVLADVVAAVGLEDRLEHRPSELSGGQQQRVAVARALASQPEIVFADEPTGNLDSAASAEILSFLRHAARKLGQTIVMVTHDPGAAAYASRVLFLADGRIVDDMTDPTGERVLDRMKKFGE